MTLKDGVSPYYVATFLNSRYGQNQINRLRTVTGQPNINMALIKSLKIPFFSDEFSEVIESIVMYSNEMFRRANNSYQEAEKLLIDTLGFKDFNLQTEQYSIKSLKNSFGNTGRLDAEFYQTEYDDFVKKLKEYNKGCGLIGDICTIKDENYNPDEREEYFYIELANVGSHGDISDCDRILGKDLPSRARRKVHTGDVIISSVEGSLSKCALITSEWDSYICTNGFYVLNSDLINSETLMILFKSRFVQVLMKRGCSGTILSAIGKDELCKIPLPIIENAVQDKIKKLITDSNVVRKQGKELLNEAIQLVEFAIESGEGAVLKHKLERGSL